MTKAISIFSIIFMSTLPAFSYTFQQSNYRYTEKPKELPLFVQSCMYGAIGGAIAGTTALAFSDRPSQSLGHIARGASIGLYVGAIYGAYQAMNSNGSKSRNMKSSYSILPKVNKYGQVEGAEVRSPIWRF